MNKTYPQIQTFTKSIVLLACVVLLSTCQSDKKPCDCPQLNPALQKPVDTCGKLKVFLENSGSMDGYGIGYTEFKANLQNVVNLVENEATPKATELYYRNNRALRFKGTLDNFAAGADPDLFKTYYKDSIYDRSKTNTADGLAEIISGTKADEISIFISDCVYSPTNSNQNIIHNFSLLRSNMQRSIEKKLSADKDFSVLLYRFTSTFTGIYYDINDEDVWLTKKERPYFVWIFGPRELLAKIYHALPRYLGKNDKKFQVYANFATVPINSAIKRSASYELCDKSRWHIADVKDKNKLNFELQADLSTLPFDAALLEDKKSYTLQAVPSTGNYELLRVQKHPDDGKTTFTHEFRIGRQSAGKRKREKKNAGKVGHTLLTLTLQRPPMPAWVQQYDDPEGKDILKGPAVKDTRRTFGLKPLIEGVEQAYAGTPYFSITLQIL